VSGGRERAFAGELSVMVGGDRTVFDRLQGLFRTYGSTVKHLGATGSGQSAKIVNNALMIANLQLADEALAAAARLGLDAHAFQDLLLGSTAASTSLSILVGLERGAKSPASGPNVIRKDIALLERLCRTEDIDPACIAAASSLAAQRADALLRNKR
jgi:3-hydroxyisobutyrate dehydrogenase-like beta-hydroxyacid dehydrogenase